MMEDPERLNKFIEKNRVKIVRKKDSANWTSNKFRIKDIEGSSPRKEHKTSKVGQHLMNNHERSYLSLETRDILGASPSPIYRQGEAHDR